MVGQANAAATFQVPFNPAPTPGIWVPRTPTSQLFADILAENYDSPMTQQYSLNLQYQFLPNWLVEVGYVGTRSERGSQLKKRIARCLKNSQGHRAS